MPRYVPNTYNNGRVLRIIINVVITIIVATIVLFLTLFFVFESYFVDGELVLPWEAEDEAASTPIVMIDDRL